MNEVKKEELQRAFRAYVPGQGIRVRSGQYGYRGTAEFFKAGSEVHDDFSPGRAPNNLVELQVRLQEIQKVTQLQHNLQKELKDWLQVLNELLDEDFGEAVEEEGE
jgi:hypothetical protein